MAISLGTSSKNGPLTMLTRCCHDVVMASSLEEAILSHLGVSLAGLGASSGHLGAILGHLGAILGHLGLILGFFVSSGGSPNIDFPLSF